MKFSTFLQRRLHWINLPGAILMVLLQRMPALNAVVAADEMVAEAPVGVILRSVVAAVAALGAVNTMAGATPLVPSSGTSSGITVAAGSSVFVSYTVNGTQTPPESWSVSGSIPPGLDFSGLTDSGGTVNTSFLNLSGTPTTGGTYSLTLQAFEFSDGGGIESPSYHYTITVTGSTNVAPSITAQPASQTVTAGNSVTFSGAASGSPNPTYQWQKNGGDIGGATGTSYTISSTSPGDAGSYTIVATNAAGSATSNAATLTVNIPNSPPAITSQPQSQVVVAGSTVTFFAGASGTPDPGYQWQKDGGNIGGANGSSYTIFNVSPGDAGNYAVVAFNVAGSATSNAASLTVYVTPVITTQPVSQTVTSGNSVTFIASVTGTPAPSFQWQKNNVNINGATGTSLTLNNVQLADAGNYTIIAANAAGSINSNAATLTVNVAPAITTQPQNSSVFLGGGAASFTVVATGGPTPTLQWQRLPAGSGTWADLANGGAYGGVTSATVTISGATLVMSGDQFRCIATNVAGTATSNAATLTVVVPLPVINTPPASQAALLGTAVNFSVTVTSPVAVTYQWQKGGVDIGGATASTYSIASFAAGDVGSYAVVVTNSAGPVSSAAATLAIALPPVITTDPASQRVNVGNPVSFTVVAASNAALSYQWRKGGTPIAGATAAAYTIASTQFADAGGYDVVVSTIAGSVTSAAATLSVIPPPPVITVQPASQTITPGASVNFAFAATGSSALTYQWQVRPAGAGAWTNTADGSVYTGSQTATLTVSGSLPANSGDQYRGVATDLEGSTPSNAATLTVSTHPGPIAVMAGGTFTVYQLFDGSLSAMGANSQGELGDGTATDRSTPVATATGIAAASAGSDHQLLLQPDGSLWSVGYNQYGALGSNDTTSRLAPYHVTDGVAGISAGYRHSLFIRNDGTLWAVGWNAYGQLGDGTTTDRLVPVQVASHVIAASAGVLHSIFLKSDGTVWAMGDNSHGQLGDGTTTSRLTPVPVASGVMSIIAGGYHNLLLKSDGTLWTVGWNAYGQLGDGTTTDQTLPAQLAAGVQAVGAGLLHSLFLKTDGSLWTMGLNDAGQLGDGTTTTRLAPIQLAAGVTGMSAGRYQSGFVRSDGSLWLVGGNSFGQLGDGTGADHPTPVQLLAGVVPLPALVTGVTASKTAGSDRITLNWSPALGATYYEVWRGATAQPGTAGRIATRLTSTFYEDLTAASGTTYSYWIRPANGAGVAAFGGTDSGFSGAAPSGPTITAPPQAQAVSVGDSVTFSVTAGGTAPFTYQWQKNTGDIPGATASSYTINSVVVGDAGGYDVVVTNAAGNITSTAATLTVNQLTQTITFNPLADRGYSPVPIALSATASSGLTVSFTVQSGPATLTGNNLTLTGTGTVTVRASQAGDATYAAAANVDQSFNVAKAAASVTLGSLTPTYDGTPHSATATTNPVGLAVNFTYDGSATAQTNAGSYAVVATISDTLYQGLATGTLVIAKADQAISFTGPANQPFSATPITLSATATSGLTVTFAAASGPASVSGTALTLTGAGAVTVRASQSGDANRNAAPDVDQSFTVTANFGSWAQGKFTAAELLDPNISGPNAVYGQDGLPNLVKYALGLEPKQNITTGLPDVGVQGTDWVYTYTRPDDTTDVTYAVEVSADLVNWSTAGVTHEIVSSSGGTETWHGKYPLASANNVFFRLVVTR